MCLRPTSYVSNLLGSPASGERFRTAAPVLDAEVSNLLGSPASGEARQVRTALDDFLQFPIYWVPQRVGRGHEVTLQIHEDSFPIYWVPQRVGREVEVIEGTDAKVFPIYWVPQRVGRVSEQSKGVVLYVEFPIYWVPQRVGRSSGCRSAPEPSCFQFIGFPSEWGEWTPLCPGNAGGSFQFIGFPSEWGVLLSLLDGR